MLWTTSPRGDGIFVTGDAQAAPLGSGRAGSFRRATEPVYASVREFLLLQGDAGPRSTLARFFGVDPLDRGAAEAYASARAEVVVSDILDALGDQWTVVDGASIETGEPPTDHIIVGPSGIYSIGLRSHFEQRVWVGQQAFIVDGNRVPHLRDAEHEADLVAARLSAAVGAPLDVQPCLVVSAPGRLSVRAGARRVEIVVPRDLARWLARRPRTLSPVELDSRRAAAIDPGTWAGIPLARSDVRQVRERFDRIHRRIIRARRIRLGWVILLALLSQVLLIGWLACAVPKVF